MTVARDVGGAGGATSPISRLLWWAGAVLLGWYAVEVAGSFLAVTPRTAGANIVRVWSLAAVGLAGLPLALLARRYASRDRVALAWPAPSVGTRRALCLGLFLATVAILKYIDVAWRHYNDTGLTVLLYTAGRTSLVAYLLVACVTLGAVTLGRRAGLIFCFFCGASILGLGGTALGLAGLLRPWVAVLVMLPLVYLAPGRLGALIGPGLAQLRAAMAQADALRFSTLVVLAWLLVAGGGFIVFSHGLYPGTLGNDEWDHYVHYSRVVLERGSLAPNPVWYHFYLSKGAGLFFLSGALSDFLSAQLVSTCFVLVTAAILFDLLRSAGRDAAWALTGVVVFLALFDGAFFRHHVVLTGYLAFFVWAAIRWLEDPGACRRQVWVVVPLSACYLGWYLPVAALVPAAFFGLLAIGTVWRARTRHHALGFGMFLGAIATGVMAALGINYAWTGLAEHVGIGLWWTVADRERFAGVFGTVVPEYFLGEQAGAVAMPWLAPLMSLERRYEWFRLVFRPGRLAFLHPGILLSLVGLLFVLTLCRTRRWPGLGTYRVAAAVGGTFVLAALLMSQLAFLGSTIRLYAFLAVVLAGVGVGLAHTAAAAFAPPAWRAAAGAALCVLLSVSALAQTAQTSDNTRVRAIGRYLVGATSMAGVMAATDRHFPGAIPAAWFARLRERIGPTERVLALSHSPSPGYALPGVGVMSEPSYTLGIHHREILDGTPERSRALLQQQGINIFVIGEGRTDLSTLVYGRVFSPEHLGAMFKLVRRDQHALVLTWRQPGDSEPLPEAVVELIELLRARVLDYACTKRRSEEARLMARELVSALDRMPSGVPGPALAGELSALLVGVFRERLWSQVTLPANRRRLGELLVAVQRQADLDVPNVVRVAGLAAAARRHAGDSDAQALRRELGERVPHVVRPIFRVACGSVLERDPDSPLRRAAGQFAYRLSPKID